MTEYKLSDLFDLQMGKTPSRNNPEYWDSNDNKWISIGDLSKCGKFISETKEYLSDLAVTESGISLIPADTVVMSFKLSIGKTAITAEPMYSNEAIMSFRDKHIVELLPDYIYYMFSEKDWDAGTNKAVMGKTLNKATLSNIKVRVHEIEEQRKVVEVLDKVTAVIDGHQRELQSLDDLIKARFVEMFGDPEHNSKAWPVQPLDSLCSVGSSKRIYQNEQSADGVPFWRISDLASKIDTGVADSGLFIPEEKYQELKQAGLVPVAGDILVTSRGTLGRCYIIQEEDKFYFQDGMISWLSNYTESITPLYLKYLFTMTGFRKQIDGMQAGSTVAYLSIAMLKKLRIMVPTKEAQIEFKNFVAQADKSKSSVQKALDEAQTLFDSLMQEYFG